MAKHYVNLGVVIPAGIRGQFVRTLWYVSEQLAEVSLDENGSEVAFELRPDSAHVDVAAIGRSMAEVARRMLTGFRPIEERVLLERAPARPRQATDALQALATAGELARFGAGRIGLGPLPTTLLKLLDADLMRTARSLDARPHRFPALIGADTLMRCRYIESFPHSLTFASHLREELGGIEAFARQAQVSGGRLIGRADLARSECLLAPSVCFHLYAWLAGSSLTGQYRASAEGKCFRYESKALDELRLWDFSMFEFVSAGSRDEALSFRDQGMKLVVDLFDEWGLSYRIHTATDPFFLGAFAKQSTYQAAFELKYEVSASLPDRRDTLAIASLNYHQDFFGRAFGITDALSRPVHTACIGIGLERLVLAFLSQHGTEPRHWPGSIESRFREASW